MNPFAGIEILEGPELVETVQVRKHRKKRINKKWRKRYGFKNQVNLYCYLYRGVYGGIKIIAHPKVAQKIRDAVAMYQMGVIEEFPRFQVADCTEPINIPFRYGGGSL